MKRAQPINLPLTAALANLSCADSFQKNSCERRQHKQPTLASGHLRALSGR
jgi:hypothetical protein